MNVNPRAKTSRLSGAVIGIMAAAAFLLLSQACGSTSTPATLSAVPLPTALDVFRMDETDAALTGAVAEELGQTRVSDDNGGLIFADWRVSVSEWITGGAGQDDSVLVRIDTTLLRKPDPMTGVQTGLPTGYPQLAAGENVLLFLTKTLPVNLPDNYPGLRPNEYLLVGPYEGKWLIDGQTIRLDDPRYSEGEQATEPLSALDQLRQAAGG